LDELVTDAANLTLTKSDNFGDVPIGSASIGMILIRQQQNACPANFGSTNILLA
jgi:hypothetical protein